MASRRKTVMENLQQEIREILEDYEEDVQENIVEIAGKLAKKGAKALRRESAKQFGKGAYAQGWTSKTERVRSSKYGLRLYATIYNDHPGLPHLLEHGHETKNQTNKEMKDTPPHPHIETVEKELVKTFEREVLKKL